MQGKYVVNASLSPIIYQKIKSELSIKVKIQNLEKNIKQTLKDNFSTSTNNLKNYQTKDNNVLNLPKEIKNHKITKENTKISNTKHKKLSKKIIEKKQNETIIIQKENNLFNQSNDNRSLHLTDEFVKKTKNKSKINTIVTKQSFLDKQKKIIKEKIGVKSIVENLHSKQLSIEIIETINSESPTTV